MSCEYNSNEKRKTWSHEKSHAEAVWNCGAGKKNFHLCDSCSKLPEFKRLKKNVIA